MSAAKCDNILTDTNVSDGEQEIDENDLLGEALPEESSARVRVRESPPDLLYDLMKQMQESMNSMASSMKTLRHQQQCEASPRGREASEVKTVTDSKKRKNGGNDGSSTVGKRSKHNKDSASAGKESEMEGSEGESSNGDDAEMLIGAKMAAAKKAVKDCPKAKDDTTHANVLVEIEQEYENSVTGPKVEAHVDKTINKRWETRMDIKILKDKMAKYSRPDHCEMIRVPRVNTPVWKTLESHQRRNDVKITNIQKTCAAVGASLAYTLDMVCKDQSSSDLDTSQIIRYVADAMAMLGHINTDLSLLRRELMRPTLHADYRNLCNLDHPVTSLLFGDDLQKEMKDLKETSMIGSKVSSNYQNYDRPSSLQLSNHGSRRPNNYRSREFFRGGRQKARIRKKYHFKKETGQQ